MLEKLLIVLVVIINLPLLYGLKRLLFRDDAELAEGVRYSFTPNLISWMRGEYWRDYVASTKLSLLILGGMLLIGGQLLAIDLWLIGGQLGLAPIWEQMRQAQ